MTNGTKAQSMKGRPLFLDDGHPEMNAYLSPTGLARVCGVSQRK